MKKLVPRIMLGFSFGFLAAIIFLVIKIIAAHAEFTEHYVLTLLAFAAAAGLFIGLYRIIEMLEEGL